DLPKCRKLNLTVQRFAAAGRRKRAEAYSPNHTVGCATTGDRPGMGLAAWRWVNRQRARRAMRPTCEVTWMADYYRARIPCASCALARDWIRATRRRSRSPGAGPGDIRRE